MTLQTTAILADDEPFMRAALRQHLQQLWPELQVLRECEDGPSALAAATELRPQFAFLDIRMPGLTGLQVAQALDPSIRVVLVTAHDEHALEAFEANAVDYVLKPVDLARTAKLVAKLRRSLEPAAEAERLLQAQRTVQPQPVAERLEWLQVSLGTQVRLVHRDDVMYFESDSKYTRVVSSDCDGLVRLSLKELLDRLDSTFFVQTHRSVVVNLRFVRSVHRHDDAMELELKGRPERLRVSTSNIHLFKAM